MENKSIWKKDIREIFRPKRKEITKEYAERYMTRMERNGRIRDYITMGLGGGIFFDNVFNATAEMFIDGRIINHYEIPTLIGTTIIVVGARMLPMHLPDKEIDGNDLEDRLYKNNPSI